MVPIAIEFFPKESVLYNGLNILSEVDESLSGVDESAWMVKLRMLMKVLMLE